MKAIFILLIVIELLNGQTYKKFTDVYSYETNYEKAYLKARREKKNILLITVANYCSWCKKLENRVLKDIVLQKEIHKSFILVIVNNDIDKLQERFITNIIPVSYVINYKTDKIIKKKVGYQTKSDFLYFIKE
ncbi:MAG: hypothetical protein DSZ04_05820 [Sulfurimonas sp.]|nr:MAG: hypothetical protein DSZ04_05820 [Sulfurimonas sp.]